MEAGRIQEILLTSEEIGNFMMKLLVNIKYIVIYTNRFCLPCIHLIENH